MTDSVIVQEQYDEYSSHCYGCGTLNKHGLHLKSSVENGTVVSLFSPANWHTSVPGFVYGGLIASLIDCHAMASAAVAMYKKQDRMLGSAPKLRFVTARLCVDYLKPTPLGPVRLESRLTEVYDRKVHVLVELIAAGNVTAKGDVIAVSIPESMRSGTQ